MPTLGFAPDAEFPCIHGKKALQHLVELKNKLTEDQDEPDYELITFKSGERYNMVPDHAEARVLVKENMTDVIQDFVSFRTKSFTR